MPSTGETSDESQYESATNRTRIDHYRIPKISPFFKADPALWFMQVESTLRSAQITVEATKADIVIVALDFEVISAARDLIAQVPRPEDIFAQIKGRITSTFAVSAESNLRRLLKGQVLIEGKPSLILNRLRNLNDGKCDEAIMQSVFMDQLPLNARAILAASGFDDVNKLTEMADKMAEHSASTEAHVVSAASGGSATNPSLFDLQSDIKSLCASVESLSVRLKRVERSCSNKKTRSASRSKRDRARSGDRKTNTLCYAPTKHPSNPLSCREWCEKYATWKAGK